MSIATSMHPESARTDREPPGEPPRTAGLDLPAAPQSAGAARRFAAAMLAEWGLADHCDGVDLVVSELITNALLHARSYSRSDPKASVRLELEYDAGGGTLVCRVGDGSPLPPTPEQAGDTAESGRGLLLVEALSSAWDWSPAPGGGKVVWARFDLRRPEG